MQIDFTKLQRNFIEKIKNEENLILRGQDVSFEIEPNYEFEQKKLVVRIKVFGEEFSLGYPKKETTEKQLITDFYSRLHDYDTENPFWHLISLKVLELEKRTNQQIQVLREKILFLDKEIKSDEVYVGITDSVFVEDSKRGFPKFEIYVVIKGKKVVSKEIGFYEYNHKLANELEKEIIEKKKN